MTESQDNELGDKELGIASCKLHSFPNFGRSTTTNTHESLHILKDKQNSLRT